MMCIIDIQQGEIKGWFFGQDTHDLRRKAQALSWDDPSGRLQILSNELYQIEFPASGKHYLNSGHILLVE